MITLQISDSVSTSSASGDPRRKRGKIILIGVSTRSGKEAWKLTSLSKGFNKAFLHFMHKFLHILDDYTKNQRVPNVLLSNFEQSSKMAKKASS